MAMIACELGNAEVMALVQDHPPDLQRPLISLTGVNGSSGLGSRLMSMFVRLGQKVVDKPRTV